MSFITKRERLLNDYDVLFNLPSRNEGKLKAYASCTDARAWSHFCSDKSEHLADIIRKNNDTCPAKYVPTDVIVNTLMVSKNMEIQRLKRKIEELEQMLEAFDLLDLTPAQKCEIANAHEAIKAANKELEDLCLDLDLSGFTEGMDSDAFETGKSRGDEPGFNRTFETGKSRGFETPRSKGSETPRSKGSERPPQKNVSKLQSKSNQTEKGAACDASTCASDPRIQDMKHTIITKDAKLSAMKNTIAVMENDVCEPFCIYAHIFTALEKIFGILCQNDRYKNYIESLIANKDTRNIDIKGKIFFKMKVLEMFAVALMAPCNQNMSLDKCKCDKKNEGNSGPGCLCYRVETSMSLKPAELKPLNIDDKRAQLVADIMESEEMKEILSKENFEGQVDDQAIKFDSYNIDTENLNRLKNLQVNYDDLMTCYEELKHEKECLQVRCKKYEELELEAEELRSQLREYNLLWIEKEHFRKRSEDLDSLKEQYLVLTDEATNLETRLNAESEINKIKSDTIDDLRSSNIELEKKLNDAIIVFEKEKNCLQCRLMETECKVMCQDQQIKSLSTQVDRLLEQDKKVEDDAQNPLNLMNEIETLKEQLKNLKDSLICSEEEKLLLHQEFENNLTLINELKLEIEDWKSSYEKSRQRIEYLESYIDNLHDEIDKLKNDVKEKGVAMENLMGIIDKKSQEINKLKNETDLKATENKELKNKLFKIKDTYDNSINELECEKYQALNKLQLTKQESHELLEELKKYDASTFESQNYKDSITVADDKNFKLQSGSSKYHSSPLIQEIDIIYEINRHTAQSISNLREENSQFLKSLEAMRKESEDLKEKLFNFEELSHQMRNLGESHEKLQQEKKQIKSELRRKTEELNEAVNSTLVAEKVSDELMEEVRKSENLREDLIKLNEAYKKLANEKQVLQKELADKNKDLDILLQSLKDTQTENQDLHQNSERLLQIEKELADLKNRNRDLLNEKQAIETNYDKKTKEINNLYNMLENKIEENQNLCKQIMNLQDHQTSIKNDLESLKSDNTNTKAALDHSRKESTMLLDQIQHYELLKQHYDRLEKSKNEVMIENENLQKKLKNLEKENQDLFSQSQNFAAQTEDLEQALINARKELISKSHSPELSYAAVTDEIAKLTQEKLRNQTKIRDLLDKLEEADELISNLSQNVNDRDNKIAILENHINELGAETRRLQNLLNDMIETGEQIKDNSILKIDESLQIMEAHHSRATHNMKTELASLQNENFRLGEQLSTSKLETERSSKEKENYKKQIIDLQNEKDIIVSDIKQLEILAAGESYLVPDDCEINMILASLDRIRKYLEEKCSKTTTLEQTLLKVQTSSELLLSKADEAKKIIEKEKQKIINDKEDAIKERLEMEKQLIEQKQKLENQISEDKNIIKDLEAEILNHKLCMDKINQSTQNYISKLKEEMQTLQNLYQTAQEQIKDLQDKLKDVSDENSKSKEIIEQFNIQISKKCNEIADLQKRLEKVKTDKDVQVQVDLKTTYVEIAVQTETRSYSNKSCSTNSEANAQVANDIDINKSLKGNGNISPNFFIEEKDVTSHSTTAEPNYKLIRKNYLHFKLKRLSIGRLEQQSISDKIITENKESILPKYDILPETTPYHSAIKNNTMETKPSRINLIDIYHHPIHTKSSKKLSDKSRLDAPRKLEKRQQSLKHHILGEIDNDEEDPKLITPDKKAISTSEKLPNDNIFLIYKDKSNKVGMENLINVSQPNNKYKELNSQLNQYDQETGYDCTKPKLYVNVPRVDIDSSSTATTINGDNKSSSSKKVPIYSHPYHNITSSDIKIRKQNDMSNVKKDYKSLPTVPDYHGSPSSYKSDTMETSSNEEKPYKKKKAKKSSTDISKHQDVKLNHFPNDDFDDPKVGNPCDFIDSDNRYFDAKESHHSLSRVEADMLLIKNDTKDVIRYKENTKKKPNFGLEYILNTVQQEIGPEKIKAFSNAESLRKSQSDQRFDKVSYYKSNDTLASKISLSKTAAGSDHSCPSSNEKYKNFVERSVMVKDDNIENYETKINSLTKALENMEKDYKKKIDAIKNQYDSNIKNIFNEHNQGVKSLQSLHEETLQDILKIHENEVENLRTMSIEAMRKADKLDKENKTLKCKIQDCTLDEGPIKIVKHELRRRRSKVINSSILTKTDVEAFNVNPRPRSHGPCTCSLDINISDTIRNILEQVDVEQRKVAEQTFLRSIANKILTGNVESLDPQELAFLHLKVCRTWKVKLNKKEVLQKKTDTLEIELLNKQRNAQQHIAELDRKVAEERRRLQEVREAVCRDTPVSSRSTSPEPRKHCMPGTTNMNGSAAEKDFGCMCNSATCNIELAEMRSAGDLVPEMSTALPSRNRRPKAENKTVVGKLTVEERREKRLYSDEPPTRLRRSRERKGHKK